MLQPIPSREVATFRVRYGRGLAARRQVPSCLQESCTIQEWHAFCDAYDKVVVEQYNQVKLAHVLMMAGPLLGTLLILLAARATGLFMGPTIIFFSLISGTSYLAWKQRVTIARLMELCKELNNKYEDELSFEVEQDFTRILDPATANRLGQSTSYTIKEYYLKIRPKYPLNSSSNVQELHWSSAVSRALPDQRNKEIFRDRSNEAAQKGEQRTKKNPKKKLSITRTTSAEVRERLQALDQLRDVLSSDEYDSKRHEILDSV